MKVFLSPLAVLKLESLLNYIEYKWGAKARKRFLNKLAKSVAQISSFPGSCKKVRLFPSIRKCVVSKQTAFFYRVNKTDGLIEIVTFIDNRQNPDQALKEIEARFGQGD